MSDGGDQRIDLLTGESWSVGSGDDRITVSCGTDGGSSHLTPGQERVVTTADGGTVTISCSARETPGSGYETGIARRAEPRDLG